jgi:branched-subunit amino acid aminotransferase/4-amino-4-deoxychorismate lyase
MTSQTATAELGCLDGEVRPAEETFIPATDEGLLRGDGVFEVVRVYDGRPFALSDHLDRIERSAANLVLGWEVPRAELEAEVPQILGERGAGFDGLLRIVLTRGGRRLLLTEAVPPGPDRPRLGFVTYAPTRVLDGVKSLSYAANMLCTRRARERGFDEALLVTPHGRVLEAPTASVFWAGADRVLSTPPLDEHILASITRDRLLRLVEVREAPLTMEELLEAEEVFLCSTTREVQPAAAVEDHELGEPGPRTCEARDALREHIRAELGD